MEKCTNCKENYKLIQNVLHPVNTPYSHWGHYCYECATKELQARIKEHQKILKKIKEGSSQQIKNGN